MFEGLLQPTHLIVLLVIALLILGPKRLPEVGKSLGSGMRSFRDSISGEHDEHETSAARPVEARATEATVSETRVPDARPVAHD